MGAGKTRLAIQIAADLTAEVPDGVFLISLADISSSRDTVQAAAESIGLAMSSDEDVTTQLLTYLRPSANCSSSTTSKISSVVPP